MKTTPRLLSTHFQWRTKFLRALNDFKLADASNALALFRDVEDTLTTYQRSESRRESAVAMREICGAMGDLCEWVIACAGGEKDAERHRTAARTKVAIAEEAMASAAPFSHGETMKNCLRSLAAVSTIGEIGPALKSAAKITFPPVLLDDSVATVSGPVTPVKPEGGKPRGRGLGPIAIRVMLTLDGKPWANPQMLQPGTVYDIDVSTTVAHWPEGADRLVLDFVTTLPADAYRIVPFVFTRPTPPDESELRAKGHLEFQSAQSFLSEPVLLQLRATFRSNSDEQLANQATVIGYHKLRARIEDPGRSLMWSKYRALDLKLVEIVDQLRELPGLDPKHLEDFITILAGVANYLGLCAQTAVYQAGRAIPEKDFQQGVLQHLRSQLGEDVQEAPKQGGGITDIQFRTVTIELKVEDKISDRAKMAAAYENQVTQYSSSSGAQLSILCILDLTEKEAPPAPTQNNLFIVTPKLHGFADTTPPSPSRAVAAIIDGNIRVPSSYSR